MYIHVFSLPGIILGRQFASSLMSIST